MTDDKSTEASQEVDFLSGLLDTPEDESEAPAEDSEEASDDVEAKDDETTEESDESTEEADTTDSLFDDDDDENDDWDGKSPLSEHPRFKKIVQQKHDAIEAKKEAERLLREQQSVDKLYNDYYAEFKEDASKRFLEDMQFITGAEKLVQADHPVMKQAVDLVQEFVRTGRIPNVTDQKQNSPRQQSDPRIEKLLRQQLTNDIGNTLKSSRIKPEFHRKIQNDIANSLDASGNHTSDDIVEAIKTWVSQSGLTAKTLASTKEPKQKTSTPTPGKSSAAVKAAPSRKQSTKEGEAENKQPEDLDSLREEMRGQFRALFAETESANT